jgi:hypothetical protein
VGELTNEHRKLSKWRRAMWTIEARSSLPASLADDESAACWILQQKTTADLLTHVLKLYDCPEKLTAASTVGRGRQTIRYAYLTICGPTTPAAMRVHLGNRDHWGNGLFARFIFVTPNTPPIRKFYPEPCDVPEAFQSRHPCPGTPGNAWEAAMGTLFPPQAISAVWPMGLRCGTHTTRVWELMNKHLVPESLPQLRAFATTAMKPMQLVTIDWSISGKAQST